MARHPQVHNDLGGGNGDRYWRAVVGREPAADGTFVYAVRSTGIYCRPTCAARKPRRAQVVFFPGPEEAERAGFRPCRRCRPRGEAAGAAQAALVRLVCRYIDEHLEDTISLASLAGIGVDAGLSPHRLQRTFKRVLGITPRQYADARRLDRLKGRLREGETVTRALYDAGYGSSSRLYERAPGRLGMTPATYRRGGQGMRIGYAIADSPLGRALGASARPARRGRSAGRARRTRSPWWSRATAPSGKTAASAATAGGSSASSASSPWSAARPRAGHPRAPRRPRRRERSQLTLQSRARLNNNTAIPLLGLGVWQIPDGKPTADAVAWALDAGYRHVDTTKIYGNEKGVGEGIRRSGIPRAEIWVTTKLWPTDQLNIRKAFDSSLGRLDVGHIDLY